MPSTIIDISQLNIPDASTSVRGLVNTGSQTFGGSKTISTGSGSATPVLTLTNTVGSAPHYISNTTPEGAITANIGAMVTDITSGNIYSKTSGVGNTGWTLLALGTGIALSNLTSAAGVNTLTNGNNLQTWGWQLTGATNGYSITESAASTGTGALVQIGTLASSTAKPFVVQARANSVIDVAAVGGLTLGNVTLNTAVNINSGTGTIAIGTDANAKTINIGTSTGAATLNLTAGSGGVVVTGNTSLTGASTFSSGTGTNTFNGSVVIAANNTFTQNGTGTFSTGTGAVTLNGATTIAGSNTLTTGTGLTRISGSLLLSTQAISDLDSGAIGTAAATVNIASSFNINQATAAQTLTLPSPASATVGRIVSVQNVGSVSFSMHSVTIGAGSSAEYVWNGTAWSGRTSSGAGGLATTNLVTRETPTGTVNGANTAFTLAFTPTAGTEMIFLNGVLQDVGGSNDYTISGATITFVVAPLTGSKIRVTYWK